MKLDNIFMAETLKESEPENKNILARPNFYLYYVDKNYSVCCAYLKKSA